MDETILLVDDDAALLEVTSIVLASEGYRVVTAEDGAEALRILGREGLDLVVLDIMLPDINGKAVCQRIRSDSTMDQIKVICISGMVEQDKVKQ